MHLSYTYVNVHVERAYVHTWNIYIACLRFAYNHEYGDSNTICILMYKSVGVPRNFWPFEMKCQKVMFFLMGYEMYVGSSFECLHDRFELRLKLTSVFVSI